MLCGNCFKEIEDGISYCPFCGDSNSFAPNTGALAVGSILGGKYILGKVLGQGGFGITYKAQDYTSGKIVAIKEYFPDSLSTRNQSRSISIKSNANIDAYQSGVNGFLREAETLAAFQNISGVVDVYEYFQENNTAYFVMDFLEGMDLKTYLKTHGQRISWDELKPIIEPVMEALSQIHQKGMIHRDLSPDNIFICEDGTAKLVDFGAARASVMEKSSNFSVILKEGYAPKEQYLSKGKQGPYTDVYALGATMYRCLTGSIPTQSLERNDWTHSTENKTHTDLLKPIHEFTQIPQNVERAIMKAMAVEPNDRYQNVDDFLRDIQTPMEGTTPVHGKVNIIDFLKKNKVTAIAAACGIVLVAGILIAIGGRKEKEPLTVVKLGQSNSNVLNGSQFLSTDDVGFLLGADYGLYRCLRDEDGYFYLDTSESIQDSAKYLCKADEYIYFASNSEDSGKLYRMDLNGENIEELAATDGIIWYLQYAELSNGKEYLYYNLHKADDSVNISRLEVGNGGKNEVIRETEVLLQPELTWFNLYDGSIYFVDAEEGKAVLKSADLNGENSTILTDRNNYAGGIVEDDLMFMYSYSNNTIDILNLDGSEYEKKSVLEANVGFKTAANEFFMAFAYTEGWIYYDCADDNSIHRSKVDGIADSVLYEGVTATEFSFDNTIIYLTDQSERSELRDCRIGGRDGSDIVDFQTSFYDTTEGRDYSHISNCGWVAYDESDAVFIMSSMQSNTIIALGDEVSGLSEEPMTSINYNTEDGRIYFLDYAGDIYSVNMDGSEQECLFSCDAQGHRLFDGKNYFYYVYEDSDDNLVLSYIDKKKLDTAYAIVTNLFKNSAVTLYEDRFYYTSADDNHTYSMRLDGTDIQKVSDNAAQFLIVNERGIYGAYKNEIWCVLADGTEDIDSYDEDKISISGLAVDDDGMIYFSSIGKANGIYYTYPDEDSAHRLYNETDDGEILSIQYADNTIWGRVHEDDNYFVAAFDIDDGERHDLE